MQRILLIALVGMLGVAVGCQNQAEQDRLAAVPEPVATPNDDVYAADYNGDADGPDAQPEPVVIDPAPAAPAGNGSYTIRKGDTLWSIATREYGDGQRWQDIVAANPGINPQKLAVGQTITLP